ncbi:MAG: hypothetical protein IJ125_04795 [Atopobiaceae bacterium]|nr:hypothetical protein [Atopobiaceae bacterium]
MEYFIFFIAGLIVSAAVLAVGVIADAWSFMPDENTADADSADSDVDTK